MEGGLSVTLGVPQHLSIAESVSYCLYNPFGALLPHQPKGLGDAEKFCSDVAFLLVLTEEGTGGQNIWSLHNIAEPLSCLGLYSGGSSQATDCPGFYQA